MITKICQCGCGQKRIFKYKSEVRNFRFIRGHYRKFQIGEKAPCWKGGIIYKRGYVFVYNPKHPHHDQEYVKRSRLEMEKKLGRYLESNEIIHHINGIKDDDRIENLLITTRIEHSRHHRIYGDIGKRHNK